LTLLCKQLFDIVVNDFACKVIIIKIDMEFGTELMFINEAPSAVPGMLTLLQLDPYLKPYRQEIERRYSISRMHSGYITLIVDGTVDIVS